ncbi:MAG TPA: VIT and VWA domain-containing protein [Planctomycetota bacterium]|nr:VIT and VWA domain-containing protein [Planctomycetota bacterium]
MKVKTVVAVAALVVVALGLVAQVAIACVVIPEPIPIVRPWPHPRPQPVQQAFETRSHNAEITIKGPVAHVVVNAVFYNPNPMVMEGTYLFPLAGDAAVNNFEMNIDGKMVKGELLDADKARNIYEDIVRRRKDPALLEWVGTKMLKCRVFPINPNSEVKLKLDYSITLRCDGGLFEFNYPLRSAKPLTGKINTCAVKVRVENADGIKTIYSPTHQVDVTRKGENEATLGFEEANVVPERDFKLYFGVSKKDVGVSVITHKPAAEDGYFLLSVAPNVEEKPDEAQPKSIVFVMDTSGSMAGEKIDQAKGALRYCVNSLKPADHFALIPFATEPTSFRDALLPATKENVKAAVEFIDKIEARGGTAIADALALALKTIKGAKGLPMIVFLTDGLPTIGETNTETILKSIAGANAEKARLFAFGVGYDVNTQLLDKLAEENHGSPDYVSPKENIEVKVSSFYAKVANPVLSDLKLDIPGLKTADVYPKSLPDLFRGSQLMVLGRYEGGGAKAIKLAGTVAGKPREFVYETTFAETAENNFLPRLWATRKVAFLLNEIRLRGRNQELVDEVVKLGKQYGIMTPYTSFLVVEDQARPEVASRIRRDADRFGGRAEGERAVEEAKDLAEAVVGDIARPAPAAEPTRPGEKPAPPRTSIGGPGVVSGRLHAFGYGKKAKEELERVAADVIVPIADKTFYKRADGYLYDSLYDEARDKAKIVEVKAFSDEYFALLKKHPGIGRYLAEAQPVVLVIEGNVYKITPEK